MHSTSSQHASSARTMWRRRSARPRPPGGSRFGAGESAARPLPQLDDLHRSLRARNFSAGKEMQAGCLRAIALKVYDLSGNGMTRDPPERGIPAPGEAPAIQSFGLGVGYAGETGPPRNLGRAPGVD
jgi:hypothetical protein